MEPPYNLHHSIRPLQAFGVQVMPEPDHDQKQSRETGLVFGQGSGNGILMISLVGAQLQVAPAPCVYCVGVVPARPRVLCWEVTPSQCHATWH